MDFKFKIGICSVGSGMGQADKESCYLSAVEFVTVGLENNPLSYGLFNCSEYTLYLEIFALLRDHQLGKLAIFVCEDGRCQLPVNSIEKVLLKLN